MYHNPQKMMAAVVNAAGHELDMEKFDDRLTMQRGCYILNCWGYGPTYSLDLYIHGPYSRELADDCCELGTCREAEAEIPEEAVEELREIFSEGLGYVEAYAIVLLVKNNNPGVSTGRILERSIELTPKLEIEVKKVAARLLNR